MRAFLVFVLAGCVVESALSQVTVIKQDYEVWKDCYEISNGTVSIVVVPEIGRIMRYGYVSERNLLWENPDLEGKAYAPSSKVWRNYGGDKLWASPQSAWNWPPDPAIDGSPWNVKAEASGVLMESGVGALFPVKFSRQITLAASGTQVTIVNFMAYQGHDSRKLGVWEITQMDDPDSVLLKPETTAMQPKGWFGFGNETLDSTVLTQQGILLRRDPKTSRKIGVKSDGGKVYSTKGSVRFVSESKVFKGAPYPDHDSAQEAFFSADPYPYVELEQLGPLVSLEKPEVVQQTVVWKLEKS